MKENKFAFLGSVRFWKMSIAVTLFVLVQNGIIDGAGAEAVAEAIMAVFGISVGVRTVDRFSEKVASNK